MSSCCRLCLPGPQKGTESHLSVANELEQTRQGSQGAQHTCKQEPHHCTAAHSTARQEANTHKHAISGAPHADRCHSQAPHARPGTAAPSAAHPVPAASQWRTQQNPPRHPRRHQRLHVQQPAPPAQELATGPATQPTLFYDPDAWHTTSKACTMSHTMQAGVVVGPQTTGPHTPGYHQHPSPAPAQTCES